MGEIALLNQFASCGYVVVPGLLAEAAADELRRSLAEVSGKAGHRNLIRDFESVRSVTVLPALENVLKDTTGRKARAIRGILFNKLEGANWALGWHQDLTIAVKEKKHAPGYKGWSVERGVVHVHPPTLVLEKMLVLRLHLDWSEDKNGGMWVCPGSHRQGLLSPEQASAFVASNRTECPPLAPGDALLMRPLLLHASSRSTTSESRRVIQLEYAQTDLQHGLEWAEAA